jgi:signal transduction histidine kinase
VTVSAVAEEARSNVETGAATLEVASSGELDADRDRLLTVFENLIRNSLDHGRSGDRALTLRVGLLDDHRGFYIEDDGSGIPPDERGEVFDHGYTTSAEGTGLGLSIVRDIVRGHGWTIEASESADGGARFEVTEISVRPTEDPAESPDEE